MCNTPGTPPGVAAEVAKTSAGGPAPCSPPANPWLSHPVRIAGVTEEIPGVATYHLSFSDPAIAATYEFQPGQFNMLYLPGVGESAISLSANPRSRDTWAHTIRVAGNVTGTLARLGQGGALGLRGPFGTSWPLQMAEGNHVILVAGGIGLAPLRPAIYHLLDQRARYLSLTLLFGGRTPEGLLFTQEFPDWTKRGLDIRMTVDRASPGWTGNVGVVPLLLDRLPLANPARTHVLSCGPEVMMWYTAKSALERGIPRENLWLSMERNMQCAVGLCGHCQFGPAFICKDGPVFRYDALAPFLQVEGL